MYVCASGNSMHPTLRSGEKYELEILDTNTELCPGDIIVFCIDDLVVCHRITKVLHSKKNKTFICTKGDNCEYPDPWVVTLEMILGRIVL